jgi:hypothetical protein
MKVSIKMVNNKIICGVEVAHAVNTRGNFIIEAEVLDRQSETKLWPRA